MYALKDKGAVVAVDSQFPDSAKACVDGLQERSKNRGVDLLINSHHHGDHTGGNISFKDTKSLRGKVPESATFSYSFREGTTKNLDLAATGFVEPSSGIAGLVDFSGTLNSDGAVGSNGRPAGSAVRGSSSGARFVTSTTSDSTTGSAWACATGRSGSGSGAGLTSSAKYTAT